MTRKEVERILEEVEQYSGTVQIEAEDLKELCVELLKYLSD